MRRTKKMVIALVAGCLTVLLTLSLVRAAGQTLPPVTMAAGDTLAVSCPNGLLSANNTSTSSNLSCAALATATPTTAPTATAIPPTATPVPATATPTPPSGYPDSMAMHLWHPNVKFDKCFNADGSVNADATSRIEQLHDSFSVIGPDGKRYPTWHPPSAVDPVTKAVCNFGHEHGQDPSTFPNWNEIKTFFAYNGDVAHAGIPFGYVAEQMDTWSAANGNAMMMRHEDHVGNKIQWATNVNISMVNPNSPTVKIPTGVTCNYLSKVHQGTTTHDAFENNLHEVFYSANCTDGQDLKLTKMVPFGQAGQFLRLCDPVGDRSTIINTGYSYSNQSYPGTQQDGNRNITDRSCASQYFLVPAGKWSMNMYEAWNGNMNITGAQGQPLVRTLDLLFDVENSMRYYYPGMTHPELADASKYTDTGFSMDLCYEVLANGNRARGGACDQATNNGAIKGITWDDPRSAFKGTHRGVYYKPGDVQNATGPAVWYTDPFGNHGQTTYFPGAILQHIVQRNINYAQKYGGGTNFTVPEIVDKDLSNPTVHAPN